MKHLSLLLVARLLGASLLLAPVDASAQVSAGISVQTAPPPLPDYPQPFAPGPGYIWTPGYWAWGAYGYYWVPGTWVLAPQVGLLWTPGYWAWNDGFYWWHYGYWGPLIGYYGGINYGCGYFGAGYFGGYWFGGVFYYNRAVNHVNVTYIHNTYNKTIVNNTTVNRISYNGGTGGTTAKPTAEQETYARARHVAPTAAQMRHERMAMNNPAQRFSANHGKPTVAATARPGVFKGPGVVRMNAEGKYTHRLAPLDRAAYRSRRQAETRSEAPRQESAFRNSELYEYRPPRQSTFRNPEQYEYSAPHQPAFRNPEQYEYRPPHEQEQMRYPEHMRRR